MQILRHLIRPVSGLVSIAVLSLSLYMPAAQAAMVSTDTILADSSTARTRLQTTLLRADVQQGLLEKGVNPLDVQARVNALSDEEAMQLAAQLDELPAGGDGLGTLVFLFLVLVVLDIACLTNIFPFTVKHCR
ncbi:MAG: PA2779 family protein [Gammaproteobacteria bacterium]|nr:PA2779 family protein [Gammaproteobacteria bacterium]